MKEERYVPTEADKERIKLHTEKLKVSGDGAFATLQGEGVSSGEPAVFLRLHLCNLDCPWCDTKYTWDPTTPEFWQEPQDWNLSEAREKTAEAWENEFGEKKSRRLVITGGEPLLQKEKLTKFVEELSDWEIEIETNGTQSIPEGLQDCQINCSPKLSNTNIAYSRRIIPEVLGQINQLDNSWFKFVVGDKEELEEVEEIVNNCGLDTDKILIMPLGTTVEQTTGVMSDIKGIVESMGWKITERKHLEWFGGKRGS